MAEHGHRDICFVNAPQHLLDLGYGAARRMAAGVEVADTEEGIRLLSHVSQVRVFGSVALATIVSGAMWISS